jgi:hypothetical protein
MYCGADGQQPEIESDFSRIKQFRKLFISLLAGNVVAAIPEHLKESG